MLCICINASIVNGDNMQQYRFNANAGLPHPYTAPARVRITINIEPGWWRYHQQRQQQQGIHENGRLAQRYDRRGGDNTAGVPEQLTALAYSTLLS